MLTLIVRRILLIFPIAFGVSVIVFFLVQLIPGDPAQAMLGPYATTEAVAVMRRQMGLDKPLVIQYLIWFRGALSGDFGTSFILKEPVLPTIISRFPATMELTLFSMVLGTGIGIFLGVRASVRHNSIVDLLTTCVSVSGMSIPVFWSGLVLLYIFGFEFKILPISGRLDLDINLKTITNFYLVDSLITGNFKAMANSLKHLILPTLAMMTFPVASIAQMTRANMLEVLRMDYVNTARSKGLTERIVVYKHALRNALMPVVTVAGLRFGIQLAGAVFVETIFAWPGVGRLGYKAILTRDYPMIQGVILFVALVFILVNLFVDILYIYINPKIRH